MSTLDGLSFLWQRGRGMRRGVKSVSSEAVADFISENQATMSDRQMIKALGFHNNATISRVRKLYPYLGKSRFSGGGGKHGGNQGGGSHGGGRPMHPETVRAIAYIAEHPGVSGNTIVEMFNLPTYYGRVDGGFKSLSWLRKKTGEALTVRRKKPGGGFYKPIKPGRTTTKKLRQTTLDQL